MVGSSTLGDNARRGEQAAVNDAVGITVGRRIASQPRLRGSKGWECEGHGATRQFDIGVRCVAGGLNAGLHPVRCTLGLATPSKWGWKATPVGLSRD